VEKFDANIPIYIQVVDIIKREIVNGKLKPGDKILSVREMSIKFGVNPNTIQKALFQLEREGFIRTERAVGKYVSDNEELIEVYKEKEYQFIKAPGLIYVDSLAKNDNYKLVQIKKCTVNEEGKVNEEVYNCCELKCNKEHTHTEDCYEGEKEFSLEGLL